MTSDYLRVPVFSNVSNSWSLGGGVLYDASGSGSSVVPRMYPNIAMTSYNPTLKQDDHWMRFFWFNAINEARVKLDDFIVATESELVETAYLDDIVNGKDGSNSTYVGEPDDIGTQDTSAQSINSTLVADEACKSTATAPLSPLEAVLVTAKSDSGSDEESAYVLTKTDIDSIVLDSATISLLESVFPEGDMVTEEKVGAASASGSDEESAYVLTKSDIDSIVLDSATISLLESVFPEGDMVTEEKVGAASASKRQKRPFTAMCVAAIYVSGRLDLSAREIKRYVRSLFPHIDLSDRRIKKGIVKACSTGRSKHLLYISNREPEYRYSVAAENVLIARNHKTLADVQDSLSLPEMVEHLSQGLRIGGKEPADSAGDGERQGASDDDDDDDDRTAKRPRLDLPDQPTAVEEDSQDIFTKTDFRVV